MTAGQWNNQGNNPMPGPPGYQVPPGYQGPPGHQGPPGYQVPPGYQEVPDYQVPTGYQGPHGGKGDPRYPSPRTLRRALSFTFDLVLHLGIAVAVFFVTKKTPLPTVNAVGAWLGASFLDRVLVQWAGQATLGKALFALRVIRPTDGGRPGFGQLVALWFVGIGYAFVLVGELGGGNGGGGPDLERRLLPVVRRRDVRALARAQAMPAWR